jgi:crotonobetainyl-CoA:carnitine CoA-transferase CaiB-like acyl-CoA transferase
MSQAPAPLAGITVLALEQAVSAPLCTRHLAVRCPLSSGLRIH